MFEIPKDALKNLSDTDGRALVARLCEAELKQARMPVSAVRWSGAQNTPDGGLDVDCCVEGSDYRGDFVPRARTGFQVKKPSMPRSKIAKEMSPKDKRRPIFEELARCNGCYIIVSFGDDPTPTGVHLAHRLEEMRKRTAPLQECGDLHVKFYGRGEIAQWLRQHPGVQLWVRERLGIPLEGWWPFRRWTAVPPRQDDELICRDGISVELPGPKAGKYGIEDGIDRLRELVRSTDKAVRIVGLSGVGKTRIVQALFEAGVGNNPLESIQAIYADLGDQPVPSARRVLDWLKADNLPATLVLDNCPTDTHRSLADRVAEAMPVKLITVEYDIREDCPETTSVVQIQAEGIEVAEALVQRRYPDLGQLNAEHIAEFSGGNARLALALAHRVGAGEGLSGFSDSQLFERLFWQGNTPDKELLEAAQVLSLVYSFSVSENQDGVDHLAALAGLIGRNRLSIYRAAQSLVERQLAQKRGDWRAILPHAVANRLAAEALNATPPETVLRVVQTSQHLLTSFGRRLGYLHDHDVARDIVTSWLEPGGILHEIENLDAAHVRLLENVAPAAPAAVLDAVEACLTRLDLSCLPQFQANQGAIVSDLLRAIAYEAELFERSVRALARLALSGEADRDKNNAWTRLCGLFCLYLSGTEAPLEVRLPIVRHFLFSSVSAERELGFGMLEAALDGSYGTGGGHFQFGSRPRSFGYRPRSDNEIDDWFRRSLVLVSEAAASDDPALSSRARGLLASQIRSLWGYPGLRPDLAAAARRLNSQIPWLKGWRAIRMIRHYDYKDRTPKHGPSDIEFLEGVEAQLRPAALADRIRAYVLSAGSDQFFLDDEFDHSDNDKFATSRRRLESIAFSLGVEAANEPEIVDELIEELFSPRAALEFDFGKGLASQSDDLERLWNRVIEHVNRIGDKVQNCGLLLGMLEIVQSNNNGLADTLLDQALENRKLRRFFVKLQCQASLDRAAVNRLLILLKSTDIQLEQFNLLTWPLFATHLKESYLCELMSEILKHAEGANVIVDGLGCRFYSLNSKECEAVSSELKNIGVRAAKKWFQDREKLSKHESMEILNLEKVLEVCVDSHRSQREIDELFEAFFDYRKESCVSLAESRKVHVALARKAPCRFLDTVFREGDENDTIRAQIFGEGLLGENPLSHIDVPNLMAWCRKGDYQQRLATVAKYIFPICNEIEVGGAALSEQARAILDEADEASVILSYYARSIRPRAWSGSLADIILRRLPAFERLLKDPRHEVKEAARILTSDIRSWEAQWRQRERRRAAVEAQHEHRFE